MSSVMNKRLKVLFFFTIIGLLVFTLNNKAKAVEVNDEKISHSAEKGEIEEDFNNLEDELKSNDDIRRNEWVKKDNNWKYYDENGEFVKNSWKWLKVNTENGEEKYNYKYFDSQGNNINQFYFENGKTWLSQIGPNTDYYKGWWQDPTNNEVYYFRLTSGSRVENFQYIEGAWYYFRENSGTLAKSWQYINDSWYYFDPTSAIRNENTWKWFVLSNGEKLWKYFDEEGKSQDMFYEENNNIWLSQSGPYDGYYKGWWEDPNTKQVYYFRLTSGSRVESFQFIDGAWYYFREDSGTLAKSWQYITDKWYYFDPESGVRQSGILSLGDSVYKIDLNGILLEEYTKEEYENELFNNSLQGKLVKRANELLGSRYVFGSTGPYTFDCSGLTYYLYNTICNIRINRIACDQARNGRAVSKDELREGDLVFFYDSSYSYIGHVGIYVGNRKYIHAANSRTGVIMSNIDTSNRYACARRILDI